MEQANTPFISVIVPVYNLEKLVPRCLESIEAQTFADWECLVVDDGSTDQSLTVCQSYAAVHPRFRVLHQQNGGVSSARNTGMEAASGQYYIFVDGDDALEPGAMQWAAAEQRAHPESLISWTLRPAEAPAANFQNLSAPRIFTAEQQQAYTATVAGTNVTNKLFWAKVIRTHGLRYDPSVSRGEDYAFCVLYFQSMFQLFSKSTVRQYDLPLYLVYSDNTSQRASEKKIKAHPVEWDRETSRGYACRLRQEYAQLLASMGGFEAMTQDERLDICHQYLRRFAFAVWVAQQLGEALPADFFTGSEVAGMLGAMRRYRLYDAYYWPFVLKWKWLIRKMYYSDESESKKLYWKVFLIGDLLLGRRWKRR